MSAVTSKVSTLTPTEFESLTFQLVRAAGVQELVWRTPGSDGGRDIEGVFSFTDPSGTTQRQLWHIECKHYVASISWPLIYEKIAHADARGASVLLLVTNSNPSPSCEDRIREWNKSKLPAIRVWRGYELEQRLRLAPEVALSFGFRTAIGLTELHTGDYISRVLGVCHAAIGFHSMGRGEYPLELLAALIELYSLRISDVKTYSIFVSDIKCSHAPRISNVSLSGHYYAHAEISSRAMLLTIRHLASSKPVKARFTSNAILCRIQTISDTGKNLLEIVGFWAMYDVSFKDQSVRMIRRLA